jgi:hypothetical protein
MKWLLILHLGSATYDAKYIDGTPAYDAHFRTQQECRAAANVWRQLSYEAVCKREAFK